MAKNKKKKKSSLSKNIVVVLLVVLIVGGFMYMRSSDNSFLNKSAKEEDEYEVLISKDIDGNYPASPKEVIKLYQRITKAAYTEELTDEQIDKLAKQLRLLLDEELLQKNTEENHLVNLKTEILSYREDKKTIINYVVKTDTMEEWEKNGENFCSLISTLGVKEGTVTDIVGQRYVLKEDVTGKWKILGFTRVDLDDKKTEE